MCCGVCAIVVSNNEKRTPQTAPRNKYGSGLSSMATGPTMSTGNPNKMIISQSYQRTVRDLTPRPVRLQDEALVSCSKIISQQQNYLTLAKEIPMNEYRRQPSRRIYIINSDNQPPNITLIGLSDLTCAPA